MPRVPASVWVMGACRIDRTLKLNKRTVSQLSELKSSDSTSFEPRVFPEFNQRNPAPITESEQTTPMQARNHITASSIPSSITHQNNSISKPHHHHSLLYLQNFWQPSPISHESSCGSRFRRISLPGGPTPFISRDRS